MVAHGIHPLGKLRYALPHSGMMLAGKTSEMFQRLLDDSVRAWTRNGLVTFYLLFGAGNTQLNQGGSKRR